MGIDANRKSLFSMRPRFSLLGGSLRPNATSLRPATEEPSAPSTAPPAATAPRVRRRWLAMMVGVMACAVIAGVATRRSRARHAPLEPVRHLVSGRAGLRKTPSGADERWSPGSVTVTIDPTLAGLMPNAKDAVASAFGAWLSSGASVPRLSFNATSTPGQAVQDGVNLWLLGPITIPGQERDLAITISYADEDTGTIVEADTIFNDAYDWTAVGQEACDGRYDLQNVATHEAGHFFGLGEDYQDVTTTMYVSSKPCQTSKRTLSAPDISVVTGLYAQTPTQAAGCGGQAQ
jgi:hypothetical protein